MSNSKVQNNIKDRAMLQKQLHHAAIIIFLIGIVVTIIFISMTIFMLSGSPDEDPGQKMARGVIPGMVIFCFILPASVTGLIIYYKRTTQLYVELKNVGHDKFYYLGYLGIILCLFPVISIALLLIGA